MVEVGDAVKPLVGDREPVRSARPTSATLADMLAQHATADMAFVNGGSIRAGIPKGAIRIADCINAFPFNQSPPYQTAAGTSRRPSTTSRGRCRRRRPRPACRPAELPVLADRRRRERKVHRVPRPRRGSVAPKAGKYGGFLQVSRGVSVRYENGAVKSLLFCGAPLEDEKIYTVATSEFTAGGGDGLNMFREAEESLLLGNMTALFIEAVKAVKLIDVDTDGRINSPPAISGGACPSSVLAGFRLGAAHRFFPSASR
jgi:5'-nucleotidase